MGVKNDKIDLLLEKWKKEYPSSEKGFRKDGIINEAEFEKLKDSKKRILFICKEPNGTNHEDIPDADFRLDWDKDSNYKYIFGYRIAEWAFGIINDFQVFSKIHNSKESENLYQNSLRQIAFMNIKKTFGVGVADHNEMLEHAKKYKSYILKQIEIIDPDIIILSIGTNLRDVIFENEVNWKDNGYTITLGKYKNAKIVDFYHPSARNAPAAAYVLLEKIIKSEEFKYLYK